MGIAIRSIQTEWGGIPMSVIMTSRPEVTLRQQCLIWIWKQKSHGPASDWSESGCRKAEEWRKWSLKVFPSKTIFHRVHYVTGSRVPRLWRPKTFMTQMLTRDVFVVANILCIHVRCLAWHQIVTVSEATNIDRVSAESLHKGRLRRPLMWISYIPLLSFYYSSPLAMTAPELVMKKRSLLHWPRTASPSVRYTIQCNTPTS